MSLFSDQIEERRRLDDEQFAEALESLAASLGSAGVSVAFSVDDAAAADSAVEAVLAYYGAKPGEVSDAITDPNERIEEAVRPSGVMTRPVKLEDGWWRDATGAYLGRLSSTGEPVAMIPRWRGGYSYVLPETGRTVRLNKKTEEDLDHEALCFYRPLPARELTRRDIARFMRRSLDMVDYAILGAAAFAVSLVGLLPAVINYLLFNMAIPSGKVNLVAGMVALLVGVTVATSALEIVRDLVSQRLSLKLSLQIEAAVMARLLSLPSSFFRGREPGDVASRILTLRSLVNSFMGLAVGCGLVVVLSVAYVFQLAAYTPTLTFPAFCVADAQVLVTIIVVAGQLQVQREVNRTSLEVSGVTPAILSGIQKIKLAGAEKRAFAQWAKAYTKRASALYDQPLWVKVSGTLPPIISIIGTIVIYLNAAGTHVTVPEFVSFNVAYGALSAGVLQLANYAGIAATLRPQYEIVEPILKAVPEKEVSGSSRRAGVGSIEVSGVTFRYDRNQDYVLNDLSFKVARGEYVAIVGRSGCGKSTIMRLLLGFERPERGSIFYGGQDLETMDLRALRRAVGVCMQDGELFSGDLFSNITISSPRATLDDAWEAAELAGIADDIRAMPMGMNTLISEGSGGVSGGQRQRIMIARAVCSKPKILLFDEATSALDNITQRHVSESLASLKCTRIVVAHRLSTIKLADRILLIDKGRVAEEGTYDELIERGGMFADLVERQHLEGE